MKRSLLVLLALLVAAATASASTFLAMPPRQLVAESHAVVQGEVLKVNSFWEPEGRVIVSEAMLRVTDTVVGSAPGVVILRTHGGDVNGFRVVAEGFPSFEVGSRVLLFLRHQDDGTSEVTGYRLGQYRIVTDRAGVERAVPTLEQGVRLLSADGRLAARPATVELETFKEQIRALDRRTPNHRTTGE